MNINEVDFDPSRHTLWDQFVAQQTEKTGKPPISKNEVIDEIEAAESMGAMAALASKYGLKLPGNIKNVKTAKTKLISQLEE